MKNHYYYYSVEVINSKEKSKIICG